ncbi:MAG: acyltransferase domain-containing protein [Clostridiales bacterium]|nr:acyltransferase domain-containing protein [Clostridiales bacterium]
MNVIEICEKINVPQEMLRFISEKLVPAEVLQSLTDIGMALTGYQRLKELLGNDDNGLKMFACMLNAATITYEKYRHYGISDKIFFDTMYCFTRFAKEHHASYGTYGFDRGWWTYRQLSCVLFKIGELEYEYRDDEKVIHLHIPSGSDISIENCKKSLNEFNSFTAKYFPEKSYPIVCNSWLLSPALDELLPPQSKIIRFKNCFDIASWNKTENEFLQWVYGKTDIEYDRLPEKTELQKNMKKYLISGGLIGSAYGRLIDFI